MKRIITFAIMALLIGGFAINANAQASKPKPGNSNNSSSNTELENQLMDYQTYVRKCCDLNTKMMKVEGNELDALKAEYKPN